MPPEAPEIAADGRKRVQIARPSELRNVGGRQLDNVGRGRRRAEQDGCLVHEIDVRAASAFEDELDVRVLGLPLLRDAVPPLSRQRVGVEDVVIGVENGDSAGADESVEEPEPVEAVTAGG